jgi:hypothetical protein
MHNRGAFQDQAQWAALSGILYGRRHIQELLRGAARPNEIQNPGYGRPGYPGVTARRNNGGRQWLGACWTGLFSSPSTHAFNPTSPANPYNQRNAAGFEMLLGMMRLQPRGQGALRGLVYTRVRLDETLIRNGFFFGEFEHDGFAPPGYDPKTTLYFLEAIGRVDIPSPSLPLDRTQDRVASIQRATLSFQLPAGPAVPNAANPTAFIASATTSTACSNSAAGDVGHLHEQTQESSPSALLSPFRERPAPGR